MTFGTFMDYRLGTPELDRLPETWKIYSPIPAPFPTQLPFFSTILVETVSFRNGVFQIELI